MSAAAGNPAAGSGAAGSDGEPVSEEEKTRKKIRELADATEKYADTTKTDDARVVQLSQPFRCSGCGQQNDWQPNLGNTVRIELPSELHDSFGAKFTVHARPTDTTDVVKARVSALLGVPAAQLSLSMQTVARSSHCTVLPLPNPPPTAPPAAPEPSIDVVVRLPELLHEKHGQEQTVTVARGGTVASLKATLEGALGVRAVLQTLASDGKELSDTCLRRFYEGEVVHLSLKPPTLESEGVPDLGVLKLEIAGDLEPPAFVVHVELPPSLRAAHVSSLPIATTAQATFGELKQTLQTALGVKADRQTLYRQSSSTAPPEGGEEGGEEQQLKDERTLKRHATLQLSWMKLCIEDEEHSVHVLLTHTIGAVKAGVSAKLGVPAEELTLSHNGRPLHSEEATLQSEGVPDHGVLTVDWCLFTLRLSLPGDTEADAELFEWVESQEDVGHKKNLLRLAAARGQCAHCNERTGPLVSAGALGSEKKGAHYGGNRNIATKENHDELFFRFACKKPGCGGALPPVLRNATFKRNPKKAPANCNPEHKVADRLQRAWQDEHITKKQCTAPSNNEAAASSAPAAAAEKKPKKRKLTRMDECREEVFANCVRVSGRASVLLSVTKSELINRWSDKIPNCEKNIDSFVTEHGREGHEGLDDPLGINEFGETMDWLMAQEAPFGVQTGTPAPIAEPAAAEVPGSATCDCGPHRGDCSGWCSRLAKRPRQQSPEPSVPTPATVGPDAD